MNEMNEVGEYVTQLNDDGVTVVAWPYRAAEQVWIRGTLAGDVTIKPWHVVEEDLTRGAVYFRRAASGTWASVRSIDELRGPRP